MLYFILLKLRLVVLGQETTEFPKKERMENVWCIKYRARSGVVVVVAEVKGGTSWPRPECPSSGLAL